MKRTGDRCFRAPSTSTMTSLTSIPGDAAGLAFHMAVAAAGNFHDIHPVGPDINSGNVFGWPTSFMLVSNYSDVFTKSNAGFYFVNSIWITVPTVRSRLPARGYALAIYSFAGRCRCSFFSSLAISCLSRS